MGTPKIAAPVCLISAICYGDLKDANLSLAKMQKRLGAVDEQCSPFPFHHTSYYLNEMGKNLFKFFCSFERLIDPMDIVEIKLFTNEIEQVLSNDSHRRVNIDPGYLETAKLVLATTKNFGHRIYLGKGIYGDVQLYWRQNRFQSNPWTYPDYCEKFTQSFFSAVRRKYMNRERL